MKTKITKLFCVLSVLSLQNVISQSRGIKYDYQNFSSNAPENLPNWKNNNSSTYEISNGDIMVVTPVVEQSGNYYTMMARYDNKLCFKGNTKIQIPNTPNGPVDIFYNGTSKTDGGFALVSSNYPYVVRNYNNQGGLIFSKRITCPMNPFHVSSNPRLVANPYNNNLYLIFEDLGQDSIDLYPHSPTIKVIEISAVGNLINAYKFKIQSDAVYGSTPQFYAFTFSPSTLIDDAVFVKGSASSLSQDRVWLSLNLHFHGGYMVDPYTNPNHPIYLNIKTTDNPFNHHGLYPIVAVINPQGTICETAVVKTSIECSNTKLAISKDATTGSAEMTLLTVEDKQPVFYRFNNHLSDHVNQKFQLPYTFGYPGTNNPIGDLKRHENVLLFSLGKSFGTFDINSSLDVNLRSQNSGNNLSTVPGMINFVKGNTNRLYINMNYLNATNINKPSNFIVKEDLVSFNNTCRSFTNTNLNSGPPTTAAYVDLVNIIEPMLGVTISNDTYNPIKAHDLLIQNLDMCLTCQTYAGKNSRDTAVDIKDKDTLIVFPNPTHLYFEVSGDTTVEQIAVYSMLGQLVKTYEKQEQYSVADIDKGTYIVKITTTEGQINKTLIIE